MRYSRACAITSVITLLPFAAVCCAPIEIKKLPTQNAGGYKFISQQSGLKISVDPYKEEGRLRQFFGDDLLSRGIFPIFVIIENQNADGGYILNNEKIALVMKVLDLKTNNYALNIEGIKPIELQASNNSGTLEAGGVLTTASALFFPLLLPAAIFTYSGLNSIENENAIRRNLEQKQMVLKTLYPGDIHNGFLYFRISKKEDIENVQGVNINLKNLRTDQVLTFIINMINN